MATSPSDSFGFTLIEVLMAMLVMTVGLLGLLQSVQVAYLHNSRNRVREEAVLVGEELMNDFRMRGFDSITSSNAVSNVARVVSGVTRNFTVTRQSRATGGGSKRLRMTIAWSFKGVSTAHVIYTMKSR